MDFPKPKLRQWKFIDQQKKETNIFFSKMEGKLRNVKSGPALGYGMRDSDWACIFVPSLYQAIMGVTPRSSVMGVVCRKSSAPDFARPSLIGVFMEILLPFGMRGSQNHDGSL